MRRRLNFDKDLNTGNKRCMETAHSLDSMWSRSVPIDDNEGDLSHGGCQNSDSRSEDGTLVEGMVEGLIESTLLFCTVEGMVEGTGWVQRVVEDSLEVEGIEVRFHQSPFLQGNRILRNWRRFGGVGRFASKPIHCDCIQDYRIGAPRCSPNRNLTFRNLRVTNREMRGNRIGISGIDKFIQ
jgi:hypothetical protein